MDRLQELLKDRRVVIGLGVVAAFVAALLLALLLGVGGDDSDTPPPASKGGLVVEVEQPDLKVDLNRQLPCYVSGSLVGLTTHAECAQRNGVSSGQLDVGIGPSGEIAFGEAGVNFAPLPPDEQAPDETTSLDRLPAPPATPVAREQPATCWRYENANWQRLVDMPLAACVKLLFDGRCEKAGGATYGRWGEDSLRLVPGQVERSSDNRTFRTLVRQTPDCSIPGM